MCLNVPKYCCHQCLCPKGEPQLPPLLQETLQDEQVGLVQAPIKLLLLPWVLVCMRFLYVPFKSEVSISPSPVGLLPLSSAGLQSQLFWGLVFLVPEPQAGEADMGLRILTPIREPLQYNYSPVCGFPTGGYGI